MKWASSTAIGIILGCFLDSKKYTIAEFTSKGFDLILEDNSVAAGIFQTNFQPNSNILATSIWFINALSLTWDILSINESKAKITFVNEKGKQVKKLECNKTEKIDFISKSIQVFTPIGYCLYKKLLNHMTQNLYCDEYIIKPQEVINYSIYGTIAALTFNIIGSELIAEKITFDVPEDLSLYLEHTTKDGYIQVQNVIEYAEITI